jgi:hypothetical protein
MGFTMTLRESLMQVPSSMGFMMNMRESLKLKLSSINGSVGGTDIPTNGVGSTLLNLHVGSNSGLDGRGGTVHHVTEHSTMYIVQWYNGVAGKWQHCSSGIF